MTEQELIGGCAKKDAACQRKLFERYAGGLMTICLRYASDRAQAEDILQETFIRLFAYISQYKSEGSFEGWIRRIAVNCALKMLQKKNIHFTQISDDDTIPLPLNADAVSNLNKDALLKLISSLPDGYRVVFNLYSIEGYTHDEIAQMLQIKKATSRSQLAKARKLLQHQLQSFEKMDIPL